MTDSRERAIPTVLLVVLVLSLAVAQLGFCRIAQASETKSYYFARVAIDADIDRAGNMSVTETRTYQFTGTFHGSEEFIPLKTENEAIPARRADRVSVADESGPFRQIPFAPGYKGTIGTSGTFMTTQANEKLTIVYFYAAANEQKTFVIKYRIRGAVVDWKDTAELAWYFIGPEWKVRSDNVTVAIRIPPTIEQVVLPPKSQMRKRPPIGVRSIALEPGKLKIFAHGPLQGTSKITGPNTAAVSIDNLQPYQSVAVRLLFPTEVMPGAPQVAQPRLAQVMALEKRLAQEANAERARQRRAAEQTQAIFRVMQVVAGVCGGVLPLLGLTLLLFLFFKYGREPRPQFQGEYLRELPTDDPPALVGFLTRTGGQTTADFIATILDLGRRKYLKLEQEADAAGNRTYILVRTEKPATDLRDFEQNVLALLFTQVGASGRVPFNGLIDYAKSNPTEFRTAYTNFLGQVKALGDSRAYFGKHTGLRVLVVLLGLFIVFVGFVSTIAHACLCLPGIGVGVLLIALSFTLKQWSPEGMEQLVKWRAFRKFLTDFSRLDEAPPASMEIWEHYLVYAVVLGVAKEVMAQLKVVLPQVATSPENEFTYLWFGYGLSGTEASSPFENLESSFSDAYSASTPSSTSGGGGGFSGGSFGGGDFGGGGGGDSW